MFSRIWNMLGSIDALIALEQFGMVSEAAIRLRLAQSAISKRIRAQGKSQSRPLCAVRTDFEGFASFRL